MPNRRSSSKLNAHRPCRLFNTTNMQSINVFVLFFLLVFQEEFLRIHTRMTFLFLFVFSFRFVLTYSDYFSPQQRGSLNSRSLESHPDFDPVKRTPRLKTWETWNVSKMCLTILFGARLSNSLFFCSRLCDEYFEYFLSNAIQLNSVFTLTTNGTII